MCFVLYMYRSSVQFLHCTGTAFLIVSVFCTTEYTELQPVLSGVHSVMRVKLVLAGEGGGCTPPPLITFTLTSKVAVNAPAEWANTLTLFHL
jgi:hypothetical protein